MHGHGTARVAHLQAHAARASDATSCGGARVVLIGACQPGALPALLETRLPSAVHSFLGTCWSCVLGAAPGACQPSTVQTACSVMASDAGGDAGAPHRGMGSLQQLVGCAALVLPCRRTDADEALKKAQESGNQEEIEKYSKRSIKVRAVCLTCLGATALRGP